MTVEVTKLANGLTVATEHMPHLDTATFGVWVGAGSRSERPQEHGISHLLEHMAFKGTTTRSARRRSRIQQQRPRPSSRRANRRRDSCGTCTNHCDVHGRTHGLSSRARRPFAKDSASAVVKCVSR